MNRRTAVVLGFVVFLGILLWLAPQATSMPNFARKEGVSCNTCHTVIPKLNETGYKYRAAGFRWPSDIAKPVKEKFELGNYFSGRIQAQYLRSRSQVGSKTISSTNQFSFTELTLYPITGALTPHWSSLVELSFAPEEPAEVENAYIQYTAGKENLFFSVKGGIFHPFRGFGASDRPASLSRPFFQKNQANLNQPAYFTPWGFDQAGVEVAFDYKRNSVSAAVFNGLTLREEEGSILAFPAQGGPLAKDPSLPGHNRPDFQLFANRILSENGGGVSAYYYNGNLALPIAGSLENRFLNKFERWALYGGYPAFSRLNLLGGLQWGRDRALDGKTFTSRGWFAEADVPINLYATAGLRYDKFDPAIPKSKNELTGFTAFVSVPLQNGFQVIGECQHKSTLRGLLATKKADACQARIIFIF